MPNNNNWTQARFNSFIKSALRAASRKWPPIHACRKAAWIERGKYVCAGYKRKPHPVPVTIKQGKKRLNNVSVDHKVPVIDPKEGFISWDKVIERMFVEADGLQLLCKKCHDLKTKEERNAE